MADNANRTIFKLDKFCSKTEDLLGRYATLPVIGTIQFSAALMSAIV